MILGLVALLGSLVLHDLKRSLAWLGAYLFLIVVSGLIDRATSRVAIVTSAGVTTSFFVVNIAVVSTLALGLNVYLLAKRVDRGHELPRREPVGPGAWWAANDGGSLGKRLADGGRRL